MPDEIGAQCQCIKWHSPRPTRLGKFEVDGETILVCPATYTAVTDCLIDIKAGEGKLKAEAKKRYQKYPRELALRVYAAQSAGQTAAPEAEGIPAVAQ